MKTNTRTEKVSAKHGGEKCSGAASVEESCNIQECPGNAKLLWIYIVLCLKSLLLPNVFLINNS